MFKKGIYLDKINNHLTILASAVKTKNQLFLNDDNKLSEDFFRNLINRSCGYALVNLNSLEKNYPGIDLGDKAKRLCVQITATNTAQKIQDTLNLFDKYDMQKEYDTLLFFIVGYKKKYTTSFTSKFKSFNKKEHIWDIRTLLEKIYALEPKELRELCEYLDSALTSVIKIDPLILSDLDIALHIDALYDYVHKNLTRVDGSEKKYKITQRNEDFILKKNTLNKVSDVLFNAEIRPSLQYDKGIESFLGNPINSAHQKKYFAITEAFQSMYQEDRDKFTDMGSLFGYIFDEILTYKNRAIIDDQKLLILLHNMYFNCDVGTNPS